jgi:hypothetical protein
VVKKTRRVECPTSNASDALAFAEIKLASLQRLLCALAFRHVDLCADSLKRRTERGKLNMSICF